MIGPIYFIIFGFLYRHFAKEYGQKPWKWVLIAIISSLVSFFVGSSIDEIIKGRENTRPGPTPTILLVPLVANFIILLILIKIAKKKNKTLNQIPSSTEEQQYGRVEAEQMPLVEIEDQQKLQRIERSKEELARLNYPKNLRICNMCGNLFEISYFRWQNENTCPKCCGISA